MKKIKTQSHFGPSLESVVQFIFYFVILSQDLPKNCYRFLLADWNKLYKHVRKEVRSRYRNIFKRAKIRFATKRPSVLHTIKYDCAKMLQKI